jgi:ankyrin repeat protein
MTDTHGEQLLLACDELDVGGVRTALELGSNLEDRSIDGNTPLLCAIDNVHLNPKAALEIVRLLLARGADIEGRGYMDKTPFLKACSRGNLEMLRLLVESGCDIHAVSMDLGPVSGREFAEIFEASREFKDYLRRLYHA